MTYIEKVELSKNIKRKMNKPNIYLSKSLLVKKYLKKYNYRARGLAKYEQGIKFIPKKGREPKIKIALRFG